MNSRNNPRRAILLVFALLLVSAPVGFAQPQEYSFKVRNIGNHRVLKLLASEDGKNWGYFDIGDGIAPGETRTIAWDRATNNQACVQYFKAAFDDGEESPPKKFDFCAKDLMIDVR
ncbi:MAG: hypothetical protein LC731_04660 [Acidobacteria bacterium]|nr:hypothetical protein [Acidobacteriota bacterium]